MIKYPDAFDRNLPAGFDGVFDWDWLEGCFGETKIAPMDFDGVVERKGNFLIFETKNPGIKTPLGQMITLEATWQIGVCTIVFIYGKVVPETATVWLPKSYKQNKKIVEVAGLLRIKDAVKWWFDYANNGSK